MEVQLVSQGLLNKPLKLGAQTMARIGITLLAVIILAAFWILPNSHASITSTSSTITSTSTSTFPIHRLVAPSTSSSSSSSTPHSNHLDIIPNVCYLSKSKKLVTTTSADSIPKWVIQSGLILPISGSESTKLEIPKVTTTRKGLWIYCSFCHMDQTGAHFSFIMMPILKAIRIAKDQGESQINLIMDDITLTDKQKGRILMERRLFEYFTQDFKEKISFKTEFAKMSTNEAVCFERMHVPNYLQSLSAMSPEDFTYLRQGLLSPRMKLGPTLETCADLPRKRPEVWIMSRRAWSRKTLNDQMIVDMVKEVFENNVDVYVFDSPNMPCLGCLGYAVCDVDTAMIRNMDETKAASAGHSAPVYLQHMYFFERVGKPDCRTPNVDYDISFFNRVTFLISVHGAGIANAMYMPKNSVVLEIVPYGVLDNTYMRLLPSMGVNHWRYYEEDDRLVVKKFGRKMSPEELWTAEFRGALKSIAVNVTVSNFRPYVRLGRDKWNEVCRT